MRWTRMLLHALHGALILRMVFPRASAARRRALVGWWSVKLLRIVGVETRVEGPPPSATESGAMIAANHVSWLDVFVISAIGPTRFIAKSEIRDWPAAGWIAERAGTIFIRRSQRRHAVALGEQVRTALVEGDCVGLFPEGTTTHGDELLEFHSSLFEAAVANQAHVHPCAIRYERADGSLCREMAFVGEQTFMESFGLVLRQRGVVARVAFAPAIQTRGRRRRDVAPLARREVASLLRLGQGRRPRTGAGPADESP